MGTLFTSATGSLEKPYTLLSFRYLYDLAEIPEPIGKYIWDDEQLYVVTAIEERDTGNTIIIEKV